MSRLTLMIPGPIEVEDEVLEWMGAPIHAHYGPDWVTVHNETLALLAHIMGTTGKVFILPGSGSMGLDAAIQSAFAPGQKVALGLNGHFGHRSREVLEANGIEVVRVEAEPGTPLRAEQFDAVLRERPDIAGVVVVHLETSTAVLNPLREIAAVARAHGKLIMADAVSSLAGAEYQMDAWGVDITVSASQKGLGGAPGIAVVACSDRAWDVIASQAERPRSWYLDLRRWQWYTEHWADWHPFPVTMPTSVVLGLRAALQSIVRDGMDKRLARYEQLARRLRDGLRAMGLPPAVDDSLMSPVLTAVSMPPGVGSSDLVAYLAREHAIKITGGFGATKERVFRIGHMGAVVSEEHVDAVLAAVRQFMQERQPASSEL